MLHYILSHPGVDVSMVLLGIACFAVFSAYMWTNHRKHMMENIPMGVLLFIAAVVFGPVIAIAYFLYALWIGISAEMDFRFLGKGRLIRGRSNA